MDDLKILKVLLEPLRKRVASLEGVSGWQDLSTSMKKIDHMFYECFQPLNHDWEKDVLKDLSSLESVGVPRSQVREIVYEFYDYSTESLWLYVVYPLLKKTLLVEQQFVKAFRKKLGKFLEPLNWFDLPRRPSSGIWLRVRLFFLVKRYEKWSRRVLESEKRLAILQKKEKRLLSQISLFLNKKLFKKEKFFRPYYKIEKPLELSFSEINEYALWYQIAQRLSQQKMISQNALKGQEENLEPLFKNLQETRSHLKSQIDLLDSASCRRRCDAVRDFLSEAFYPLFQSLRAEKHRWESVNQKNSLFFQTLLKKEEKLKGMALKCEKLLRS
jgi:hypothetical protein